MVVDVIVGVKVVVGVIVGVKVVVGVIVGVKEIVGVIVGVGRINGILQLGQSGSNKSYLSFNILKLCLICAAFNGSVYILKALMSPTMLPPKSSSNLICVVNPEYIVWSKSFVVKHSGSC